MQERTGLGAGGAGPEEAVLGPDKEQTALPALGSCDPAPHH